MHDFDQIDLSVRIVGATSTEYLTHAGLDQPRHEHLVGEMLSVGSIIWLLFEFFLAANVHRRLVVEDVGVTIGGVDTPGQRPTLWVPGIPWGGSNWGRSI